MTGASLKIKVQGRVKSIYTSVLRRRLNLMEVKVKSGLMPEWSGVLRRTSVSPPPSLGHAVHAVRYTPD